MLGRCHYFRAALIALWLVAGGLGCSHPPTRSAPTAQRRPPAPVLVINTTDLYFPSQDGGDNFDLIMPYGLDQLAARRLLCSDLPITLNPCATPEGPFAP